MVARGLSGTEGHLRRVLCLAAAALGVAAVVAPAASASTIYACVNNSSGEIRIVSASTTCKPNEHKISWNTTGPIWSFSI